MDAQRTDEMADWLAETVGDGRTRTGAADDEPARIALGAWRQRTPETADMMARMLQAVAEQYRDRAGWKAERESSAGRRS